MRHSELRAPSFKGLILVSQPVQWMDCHGNFGPVKKLVQGTNSFRENGPVRPFLLEYWSEFENLQTYNYHGNCKSAEIIY